MQQQPCCQLGLPGGHAELVSRASQAVSSLTLVLAMARPSAEVPSEGPRPLSGTILTAVENTPGVHNLVVCTLCSCAAPACVLISTAQHHWQTCGHRMTQIAEVPLLWSCMLHACTPEKRAGCVTPKPLQPLMWCALVLFRLPAGAAGRNAALVPQPLLPQPRGGGTLSHHSHCMSSRTARRSKQSMHAVWCAWFGCPGGADIALECAGARAARCAG